MALLLVTRCRIMCAGDSNDRPAINGNDSRGCFNARLGPRIEAGFHRKLGEPGCNFVRQIRK
jgi:hypothetical protein